MPMWPSTQDELISFQHHLGALVPETWEFPETLHAVAGCFICYPKRHEGPGAAGDLCWAAAATVLDGCRAALSKARGYAPAPYQPGLLALREGPLLEEAVRGLPELPELLLVNATGRDHPRRAGLALHLGYQLSLPTVGVTRNPLVAKGEWPPEAPGACAPLRIEEEIVGYWVRVKPGKQPLAVHSGWCTSPETAVKAVMASLGRWRAPEPLRLARQAAREARSQDRPGRSLHE
jgi:deoxyribonuclease V